MNTRKQTIGGEEPRKVTEFEQDRGNDNSSTEFEQNRRNDNSSTVSGLDNEDWFKESGSYNYNKFTVVCQYIEMVLFVLFLLAWVIITLRFIVQILG